MPKKNEVEVILKEKAPEPVIDTTKIPERIMNAYHEFTPDGKEFIWGNTTDGSEFGRKEYKIVDKETGEVLEAGFKYSIPYSAKAAADVKKNAYMGCSFYTMRGSLTQGCKPENF